MTLIEKAPYIRGESFTGTAATPFRGNQAAYSNWLYLIKQNIGAQTLLESCEKASQFFELEPDIARVVPKAEREEMFYSLKNGFTSPACPARTIYLLKKLYKRHNSPNLIFKLMTESDFKRVCAENSLVAGYSLQDVICSVCEPKYLPLSEYNYKNNLGEFTEVYIPRTDMVSIMPTALANQLSVEDIHKIIPDSHGLRLGNTYISFLGGYNGACNSVYDLRRLI